ncbi:hypothetical protein [Govanella unica]|uniref:Uncharacterized protein n=1 Tax=Govanella unica TaxID=2975056 RepID=A0A9X3Z7W9_9PROT|nr:hypothetical protein [Govania unica]MDA5194434.1 hypothetical protein [Govania unica]
MTQVIDQKRLVAPFLAIGLSTFATGIIYRGNIKRLQDRGVWAPLRRNNPVRTSKRFEHHGTRAQNDD